MMEISDDFAQRLELTGIPRGTYDLVPLTKVHKFIAQRLTDASREIPSFPLEAEVSLDTLLARRAEYNAANEMRVSINDLIIKAAALALMAVPEVNASFTLDGVVRHHNADIAVAVAVESGLVTPIVRTAEIRDIGAIALTMQDFIARAKLRKLKPDEYMGGTFSISNLGMLGITRFGSIINPPHGAILSVGAGQERVVSRDGNFKVISVMAVTLTCDHRVVDGATGARWLQAFRAFIEQPDALFSRAS
ncbi:MAG: 2-oxo acid dehydrogenase subunit E2 [Micavibrio sp.]|nr:2-oxo acid dehydrogenase subunit E2 [Micavibrio sp.]